MNKLLNTLLFLIAPCLVYCTTGDSVKPEKAQIGIILSPDYCYRTLKANTDGKWMADILDTMEIPKFGYSAGFNVAYAFNPRFTLEAELLFSNKGENTKKYDLGNTSFPNIQTSSKIVYRKNYYYLDIPLKINYYLLTGKVKFFLTTGVSVNTFLGQSTFITTEYNDGAENSYIGKTQPPFEKINIAFLAGLGLNYDLTDRYSLKFEPIYKRSINSIINAPVKSYLYSIGLNLGIGYNF